MARLVFELLQANNLDQIHSKAAVPFYFKEHALSWYQALPIATRESYDTLLTEMNVRFNGLDGLDVDMEILGLTQRHGESCASYFTRILKIYLNQC